jgi:phage terminase small subunit
MGMLAGQHELFCQEYIKDYDSISAVRRAYGEKSYAALQRQAHRLLQREDIQARIQELNDRICEEVGLSRHLVARQIVAILKADPRKIARWARTSGQIGGGEDGQQLLFDMEALGSEELDDDTAAAIAEIETTKSGVKIKTHSKTAILKLAAEISGLLSPTGSEENPLYLAHTGIALLPEQEALDG